MLNYKKINPKEIQTVEYFLLNALIFYYAKYTKT